MSSSSSNLVTVGRITGVFGIKGWVKVHSDTEPRENILEYSPWWLKTRHGVKPVEIDQAKPHGNGLIAHIKGVDDRTLAEGYTKVDIAVERDQMPELEDGEYYWHQLVGLKVISEHGGSPQLLGKVQKLMATGANDVLVVKGDKAELGSLDNKERLVPYVPGQFVTSVDLQAGEVRVDWDPEF
ncbi:ribosome maturation factor RimM [Pseudoteredinibacter isoporae]|uniref:Ribosome maturation factor RimM n=1 Tax=Pseudoteredinibacter isoporae TaxID=570281 RepID=A0A7X0JXM2_9GAMM|nr:ribosome maturation factor RimM [Pseudoteredinibacter isoporae]MBB6523301.1 16S rRNA processing protein RimM [Pseudoteredinibacter isoporae]NHO88815.1 ribosome maturation factor RimM [Pseudoteredinibacter isoporae]NIB24477.1 ribosome maturation factor RimM [Pseudoteredinibacter isoporae]